MRKLRARKKGWVQQVIKPMHPNQLELAQIEIEEGEHLYREIRVENALEDENGKKEKMKEGEAVEVVIEKDGALASSVEKKRR